MSISFTKPATTIALKIARLIGLYGLLIACGTHVNAQGLNPIIMENIQSGTEQWKITQAADDTTMQVKGYASASSVNIGEQIDFRISVNTPQAVNIEIYRMGWYGGTGGRLIQTVGPISGITQAAPVRDIASGLVYFPWTNSYTLQVPLHWTSGVYLAKLINAQGFENYIIFVVRNDDREADFLYQQPVTTYQAYNTFPGGAWGKSLYDGDSSGSSDRTANGTHRAHKVSFDRPYLATGEGQFFRWEQDLVMWLEYNGYDINYATNIDLHAQGANMLRRHKGFLSGGHDEYWSPEMYDAAEQARNTGVNLAFFGSNAVYFQVRFEDSASGQAFRTMVCYKNEPFDPEPNNALKTVEYRKVGRAEQQLIGVQYLTFHRSFQALYNTDYVVQNSNHWIYAGTGFTENDTVFGITGYEIDSLQTEYPLPVSDNHTLLSASPFLDYYGNNTIAHSSIYQAPSSAWVFATGTMSWSWALYRQGYLDTGIQIATQNVLRQFRDSGPLQNLELDANFNAGTDGFTYTDDAFNGTSAPAYAVGDRIGYGGVSGGALRIRLGGNNSTVSSACQARGSKASI